MEIEFLTEVLVLLKIPVSLQRSDDSSVDSEEEYIPSPKEESTDSDFSVELSIEYKGKDTSESPSQSISKSSSQSNSKSSSQSRCKYSGQSRCMSSSRSFKTGIASTQSFPDSRADVNEESMAQTHTNK